MLETLLAGNGGGARSSPESAALFCWERAVEAASAVPDPSCEFSAWPFEPSGSDLDFFTLSLGSSWHRCPILRLTQRVHGRSYVEHKMISYSAQGRVIIATHEIASHVLLDVKLACMVM